MPDLDSGATAWLLVSSAFVMFMVAGLALFYGGLVRQKNVLSTIMHSFFALGVISLVWFIAGYALAFGPSAGGFVGGGEFYFLDGVAIDEGTYAEGVPDAVFMVFQLMFAIITPALISGAFAERMRFGGYVAFIVLWSLAVYSPVAHWVWGGGWLEELGVMDFAGGTVVHINAGVAALACALYLGRRRGWPDEVAPPHNVPMTVLGAAILWFGWFGFNAGSALAADSVAASAFVATQLAAGAAVVGWAIVERIKQGAVTAVGAATGAVGGLVAITPAAGFVRPWGAVVIGLAAGVLCYLAVSLKYRFRYDDSLDVVGVHLVGGVVGAFLLGFLADPDFTGEGVPGAIFGNWGAVADQTIGIAATFGYAFVLTMVILWIVDKTIGLRVDVEDELAGCDLTQHSEAAYSTADAGTASIVTAGSAAGSSGPSRSGGDRPGGDR